MPQSSSAANIDVDINQIATDLNLKADTDLINATQSSETVKSLLNNAGVKYVVETYSNGTSWYRVWSDGWCEQGGRFESSDGSSTTVSFLKEFLDINYTLVGLAYGNQGIDQYVNGWRVITLNTSSAVIKNNTNGTNSFMWYACGWLAQ